MESSSSSQKCFCSILTGSGRTHTLDARLPCARLYSMVPLFWPTTASKQRSSPAPCHDQRGSQTGLSGMFATGTAAVKVAVSPQAGVLLPCRKGGECSLSVSFQDALLRGYKMLVNFECKFRLKGKRDRQLCALLHSLFLPGITCTPPPVRLSPCLQCHPLSPSSCCHSPVQIGRAHV